MTKVVACAFADFFMQKIDRIRSEIAARRSATELTTISETVQCFSCETKFQSFKSRTNDEVFRLIKSGTHSKLISVFPNSTFSA